MQKAKDNSKKPIPTSIVTHNNCIVPKSSMYVVWCVLVLDISINSTPNVNSCYNNVHTTYIYMRAASKYSFSVYTAHSYNMKIKWMNLNEKPQHTPNHNMKHILSARHIWNKTEYMATWIFIQSYELCTQV